MKNILVQVSFYKLAESQRLEFDLFNEKGDLIYKKGQKIDEGFLLMLRHMKVFKKDIEDLSGNQDVETITREILIVGIKKHAQKILVEPFEDNARVLFYIENEWLEGITLDKNLFFAVKERFKQFANIHEKKLTNIKKANISISLFNKVADFLIEFVKNKQGEYINIELLEKQGNDSKKYNFENIYLSQRDTDKIKKASKKGIFVITGDSEAGQTKFLYTFLNYLKNNGKNIISFENGIETYLKDIQQIYTASHVNLADVYKDIIEAKTGVISIKDNDIKECSQIAIKSYLSGNFTIMTIPSNNWIELLKQTDLNKSDFDKFINGISGIITQKGVMKICEQCKENYKIPVEKVKKHFIRNEKQNVVFFKGRGCSSCDGAGYNDYVYLYEVIILDESMKKILSDGIDIKEIDLWYKENFMETLKYDGMKKVICGLTTLEEIERL